MFLDNELRAVIETYIGGLDELEGAAMRDLFGIGKRRAKPFAQLCADYGVSPDHLGQMYRRLLFHLGRTEHFDALPVVDIRYGDGDTTIP